MPRGLNAEPLRQKTMPLTWMSNGSDDQTPLAVKMCGTDWFDGPSVDLGVIVVAERGTDAAGQQVVARARAGVRPAELVAARRSAAHDRTMPS